MKLIVRDGYAEINGDKTVMEMPSGSMQIVSDDGRALLSIYLTLDGRGIEVSAGGAAKHGGVILDSKLLIQPRACNSVNIIREIYQP